MLKLMSIIYIVPDIPSASVFCLVKVFLGGGLGSSASAAASATTSVLRERMIGAPPDMGPATPAGPGLRGGGSGAPRSDARSCGCDSDVTARDSSTARESSPSFDHVVLKRKETN